MYKRKDRKPYILHQASVKKQQQEQQSEISEAPCKNSFICKTLRMSNTGKSNCDCLINTNTRERENKNKHCLLLFASIMANKKYYL